jgi:hypothetical protein
MSHKIRSDARQAHVRGIGVSIHAYHASSKEDSMKRLALLAASLLVVAGCEDKKPATPAPAPNSPAKSGSATPAIPGVSPDTSKGLADIAAGAKQKAVEGYQKVLDDAKAQMDSWNSKLGGASADQKPSMQSAIDKAKGAWDQASQKLAGFKSSASADWQKLASDVEASMDSLKKHLSDGGAAFK